MGRQLTDAEKAQRQAMRQLIGEEVVQYRADDPEEAERRCAEVLRLPKDFQDSLIDGALDDLFPRHERRDV